LKLSKKQTVYSGLLAVAVVALAIDRIFYSEPATAQASPVATQAQAAPALPSPEKTSTPEPAITVTAPSDGLISDHLKLMPMVDLKAMPDAFAPSKAWTLASRPPPLPSAPVEKIDHSAADFAAAHTLSAVLASHNGGAAIVNGEMLRVGQILDGFTLISVKSNTARFTNGTSIVDLTMAQ
jgi:hypothetical protein